MTGPVATVPPTTAGAHHVRSTRVLLDGTWSTATVELTRANRGWTVDAIRHDGRLGDDDLGDLAVVPAPLDLHFHGAGGHAVPPSGDPLEIDGVLDRAVEAAGWSHGSVAPVYEWIATLPVPQRPPADPVTHVMGAAASIAAAPGTGCVGLRIEGCFLNASRAGVWPPETFRLPDLTLLEALHSAATSAGTPLRIVDVAPELPGALDLIECAVELGVVVSLAHSNATWDQAIAAIDAGATLATHTWNAMRPVAHRDPGIVAAVLADRRVTCELICDGVHLHHGTIAMSVAACGSGCWVVVSDASPFAGCPAGSHDWAGLAVQHDGVALRDEAGRLAGSASLLTDAPIVLDRSGVAHADMLVAFGATPRRLLDPQRPLGLVAGDPVWIAPVGAGPDRMVTA